jgi:hypothetical protein
MSFWVSLDIEHGQKNYKMDCEMLKLKAQMLRTTFPIPIPRRLTDPNAIPWAI